VKKLNIKLCEIGPYHVHKIDTELNKSYQIITGSLNATPFCVKKII